MQWWHTQKLIQLKWFLFFVKEELKCLPSSVQDNTVRSCLVDIPNYALIDNKLSETLFLLRYVGHMCSLFLIKRLKLSSIWLLYLRMTQNKGHVVRCDWSMCSKYRHHSLSMIKWRYGKGLYDHLNKRINLVLYLHLHLLLWNLKWQPVWSINANWLGSNPIRQPKIVCQVGSAYPSNEIGVAKAVFIQWTVKSWAHGPNGASAADNSLGSRAASWAVVMCS